VQLLAVSKQQDLHKIQLAAQCGQRDFGENYVQEALDKIGHLPDLNLCWHYIGLIQSNKIKAIAQHFAWVHTLSKPEHAESFQRHRPDHLPPLNICLQLKLNQNPRKTGATLHDLPQLIQGVQSLPKVRLRGLMIFPDPDEASTAYSRIKTLFDALQEQCPGLDTLSMGTSDDFALAIKAGSTLVRVGSKLFGQRS
jgi:hypothetical protein